MSENTTDNAHKPLPVAGYVAQSADNVAIVNMHKRFEEELLQMMDRYSRNAEVDLRWLAIARTQIEQGFMALNRSIFKPERVKLT